MAGNWVLKGSVKGDDLDGFESFLQIRHQNINLLLDTSTRIFYLVGFRNTSPASAGLNRVEVFKFAWNLDPQQRINDRAPDPLNNPQGFRQISKTNLMCRDGQCTLAAGAGLHLTKNGDIYYYATGSYLEDDNRLLKFNEYV